ncbi:hypothetical protein ABIC16_002743 [Sphingomonas sp. PvP055]
MDLRAELGEHQVVALPRQRVVRAISGVFHRTPDDDPRGPVEHAARSRRHLGEEGLAEILEPIASLEDRCVFERGVGGDRLKRLKEAAALRIF